MPLYMLIDGIKGNVTTKGYEGAIQIHSLSHLGVRPVEQAIGTANRDIGMLQLDHMQLRKSMDASSMALSQYFLTGKSMPKVSIIQVSLNNGTAEWHAKRILSNVVITSMQEIANDDGFDEMLTLVCSEIQKSYRAKSASGRWLEPSHTGFDLATVRAI